MDAAPEKCWLLSHLEDLCTRDAGKALTGALTETHQRKLFQPKDDREVFRANQPFSVFAYQFSYDSLVSWAKTIIENAPPGAVELELPVCVHHFTQLYPRSAHLILIFVRLGWVP